MNEKALRWRLGSGAPAHRRATAAADTGGAQRRGGDAAAAGDLADQAWNCSPANVSSAVGGFSGVRRLHHVLNFATGGRCCALGGRSSSSIAARSEWCRSASSSTSTTPPRSRGQALRRVHGGQQLRLFNARRAGRKVWQLANVREGSPAAPGRARWTLTSSVDRPCNCTKINSNLSHVTAYKTILMEECFRP